MSSDQLSDIQKRIYREINVAKLISAVEKIPILWDTSDDQYTNFGWKDRHIWPRIANQLGFANLLNSDLGDFHQDLVVAIKARWRNLRTQYAQQLKKKDVKVLWRHFYAMSFLNKNMINYPNTSSNLESANTNIESAIDADDGTDNARLQEMQEILDEHNELPENKPNLSLLLKLDPQIDITENSTSIENIVTKTPVKRKSVIATSTPNKLLVNSSNLPLPRTLGTKIQIIENGPSIENIVTETPVKRKLVIVTSPLKRSKTNCMVPEENTEKRVAETDRPKFEMRKDKYQKEEQDEDLNTFTNMVNVLLPMVKKMDTRSKEDYYQELYNFTKTFCRQKHLNEEREIVCNINIDDF